MVFKSLDPDLVRIETNADPQETTTLLLREDFSLLRTGTVGAAPLSFVTEAFYLRYFLASYRTGMVRYMYFMLDLL